MQIFDRIYWRITNKEYNRGVDVGRYFLARRIALVISDSENGKITKKKAIQEITEILESVHVCN